MTKETEVVVATETVEATPKGLFKSTNLCFKSKSSVRQYRIKKAF